MPDNVDEGLLSQDAINEALAAAGLQVGGDVVASAEQDPADAAPAAPLDDAFSADSSGPPATPFRIPELTTDEVSRQQIQGIELLSDVELNVKIELGRARMLVDEVLRLTEGSVVELDKLAGDPVDVFVNNRLVARGEVLVLNDSFCVRISDIISKDVDEGDWSPA